jgi:ubiquinone/menaquinone biosynthesis C-methylase UbiE
MKSERIANLMHRFYGDQINGTIEFRNLIAAHLRPEHQVLDLGCGRGRIEIDLRKLCRFVAGCDYTNDVQRNPYISAGIRGDAYKLPFRNEVFDAVIMDFVLEHLEFPDLSGAEIARVLKPGGSLFFRTPNLYHYVATLARLTPHSFHRAVVHKLASSDESDPFPTFYRVNTRKSVKQVFTKAGFKPVEIRMVEKEPSYLTFAAPSFVLGYCYERVVNKSERLASFRSSIFGYFTRVS